MATKLFCVTVFSSGVTPPKTFDFSFNGISKGKAVPLQAWCGPEGFQQVKVPRFHDNGTG